MRISQTLISIRFRYAFMAIAIICGSFLPLLVTSHAFAASDSTPSDRHFMTIHEQGKNIGFVTDATTVGQALESHGIPINRNDLVEPGLDEQLVASSYDVNIYRARPVVVVDGKSTTKIMSAYQTSRQIVEQADISLHDEDTTSTSLITD